MQARQLFIRGMTQAQIGNPEEALVLYEKALTLAPQQPTLLLAIAEAHEALSDPSSALFYAKRAASQAPDEPHYARRLAALHVAAGRPQEALRLYSELLDRSSSDVPALQGLVRLHIRLDQPADALGSYNRLLEVAGEQIAAPRRSFLSADDEGSEDLLPLLDDLVLQPSSDPELYRQLARLYFRLDRSRDARRILEAAQQHAPQADFSALLGRLPAPEAPSTEQAALSGRLTRAAHIYEQANRTSKQYQEAVQLLTDILDVHPQHAEALSLIGRLHYAEEAFQDAARFLTRAVKETPRDPLLWQQTAEALRRSEQLDKAADVADEGLLLFPGHLPLLRTAGRTALAGEEYATALTYAQSALDMLPEKDKGRASFLVLQGKAQAGLGQAADARQSWEEALELDPENAAARQQLDSN